jgi:hypothetical protein
MTVWLERQADRVVAEIVAERSGPVLVVRAPVSTTHLAGGALQRRSRAVRVGGHTSPYGVTHGTAPTPGHT